MNSVNLEAELRRPPGSNETNLPTGLTRLENGLVVSDDAACDDLLQYASELRTARGEESWIMGDLVLALERRGLTDVCGLLAGGVWSKSRLRVARRVAFRFSLGARVFALSCTHYREVATRLLGYPSDDLGEEEAAPRKAAWMEEACSWLRMAVSEELSCAELERRLTAAQEGVGKIVARDLTDANRTLSKLLRSIGDTPPLKEDGELSALLNQFRVLAVAIEEGILGLLGKRGGEPEEAQAGESNELLKCSPAIRPLPPSPELLLTVSHPKREGAVENLAGQPSVFWRRRPLWQGWPVAALAALAGAAILQAAVLPAQGEKIVVVAGGKARQKTIPHPLAPRKPSPEPTEGGFHFFPADQVTVTFEPVPSPVKKYSPAPRDR